ncbi:MAG: ABC transporter permease [Bacteroidales bacterium]|nr:ABC transporter permease [Bacteroidales bacterium]
MLKNYFKIAIRNLLRQKAYSIINILGLSIGIACCILIFLYINNELSYDKFHDNVENIYRVSTEGNISKDYINVAKTSPALSAAIVKDFPEVTNAVRIHEMNQATLFSYKDKNYYEEQIFYADSSFFDIFSFKLIKGNPKKVLTEPFSIVLTEKTASKFFGNEDPVGKSLRINDKNNYLITGIVEDVPQNSHFHFNMLVSFSTLYKLNGKERYKHWGSISYSTYITLTDGVDYKAFNKKLPDFANRYLFKGEEVDVNIKLNPYLQPLTSIHLHSKLMAEIEPTGDINNVYIFSAIAIFILLIACINFMNLSTARSLRRAKEVGMRKVHGAVKKQIVFQFLGESVLLSLLGLIIALTLVELFLPEFNNLVNKQLSLNFINDWYLILGFIGVSVVVGIIAGSYPAFYLSSYQPVKVLKGELKEKTGKFSLRNLLVIFQFVISITLIISSIVIFNQLELLKNTKLGFNKDNVIVIPLREERMQQKYEVFTNELKKLPEIISISAASSTLGSSLNGSGFVPEGVDEKDPWLIFNMAVDYDYVKTMGMTMSMGRDFSREYSTDTASVIINETLLKKLGWKEPLGKTFSHLSRSNSLKLKVIGVVKDFHFISLKQNIEPFMMFYNPDIFTNLNIRIAGNIPESIDKIQQKWNELETSFPFDYFFLDNTYKHLYKPEQQTSRIFNYFTYLAIFISCLGLFGLASYVSEQRTKEMGIRKVFGASVKNIIVLLSKEFLKWILIANIIAWPLAYYLMNKWLQDFAYRTETYLWIFIISALAALFIALFTVSFQAIKAASANPIDSLKYE